MHIAITEVGPRDGLQNEISWVPTDIKVKLIDMLSASGLKNIEVTSFVSDKAIPQMADNAQVFASILRYKNISYSALVPNKNGLDTAINAKANKIALFTAASETFNQKNINCSIDESIKRFSPVIEKAHTHKIPVRVYISCVLGCPL